MIHFISKSILIILFTITFFCAAGNESEDDPAIKEKMTGTRVLPPTASASIQHSYEEVYARVVEIKLIRMAFLYEFLSPPAH